MTVKGTNLKNMIDQEIQNLLVEDLIYLNVESFKFRIIPSDYNLNKTDAYGRTLLHHFVNLLKATHVQWLLFYGADPEINDQFGKTPIDYLPTFNSKKTDAAKRRKIVYLFDEYKTSVEKD